MSAVETLLPSDHINVKSHVRGDACVIGVAGIVPQRMIPHGEGYIQRLEDRAEVVEEDDGEGFVEERVVAGGDGAPREANDEAGGGGEELEHELVFLDVPGA